MAFKKVTGKRRRQFIADLAFSTKIPVGDLEKIMKKMNQDVVECNCDHKCCKARDGLILENIGY